MASQQFNKASKVKKNKKNLWISEKQSFCIFYDKTFSEHTGENNTLYYTKSLLSNGLYSIIYSYYLLKIKNKSISIVCEIFTC
jgi:hypothetical protein